MISYNDLYEALRKEKYSNELQQLPKNFIEDVAEYFKEKSNINEDKGELFKETISKDKKKLENAIAIFKELIFRRKKKILNLAFVASETGISKKDFENMLFFEKELFEDVLKSLEKAEKDLNDALAGEKKEDFFRLVRFLEDVDALLSFNGEEVGPFKKGEIANIEKEIAEILAQEKKVEILED